MYIWADDWWWEAKLWHDKAHYLLSMCRAVFVFTITIKACVWEIKYWLFMTPSNRAPKTSWERARRRELHQIVSERLALPQISAAHTPETNRDTPRAPPHASTPRSRSTVSINYLIFCLQNAQFWHCHFLGMILLHIFYEFVKLLCKFAFELK